MRTWTTRLTTTTIVVLAVPSLLTGCGTDTDGGGETAAHAAERLLNDDAELRQSASLSGTFDIHEPMVADDGDCAAVPFVEERGPYDLTLVLHRVDDGTWEAADVITGLADSADTYC